MEPGRQSRCEAHNLLKPHKARIIEMSQAELDHLVPARMRAVMAGCQEPNAYRCPHTGCINWVDVS